MAESAAEPSITPESFAVAAAAVLADLFGVRQVPVEVGWTAAEPEGALGQLEVRAADGEGFGYRIPAEMDDEYLRYTLGHCLSEYLPELSVTWAHALPPCPGHEHPAEADWDEKTGTAWWRCPHDRRLLARIGSLAAAR